MAGVSNGGIGFTGFFEKWKSDWIDPALGYVGGGGSQTDSHLNDVSIEYPEIDVRVATNNFDPQCMLGSGTFGSVYKGTMRDGTEVAIKVLQVPEEAGFEEEVKVLSRFRHPNLVILMGFTRHNDTGGRSLIYEYLSGGDVSKRLQRSRQSLEPFEWKSRLSAGLDAACGLSHLHNLPVRAFHRDIKGPNILLDKNDTAKMADFGLSCVSQSARHKVLQASGTVGYACPEYIRTGVITEFSEVHSFGMVLFELLTGAPPAVARPDRPNEFCYLVDHLQGSVAKLIQMLDPTAHFPPVLSQRLAEIGFACIGSPPEDRPLFKRLVEDLRALLAEEWQEDVASAAGLGRSASKTSVAASPKRRPQTPQLPQVQPQHQQQGYARRAASPAPPHAVAQAVGSMALSLAVGQVVEARWRGGLGWFRGRIARVYPNGTFGVRYDDNEYEDAVAPHLIRPLDASMQQALTPRQPSPVGQLGVGTPQAGATAANATGFSTPVASRVQRATFHHAETAPPCRLWCVHAEGVELGKLSEQQRAIPMAPNAKEMVVGRTAQPTVFWNTLVPDQRLHGTVSREHFKIVWRVPGAEPPSYYLTCLSLNGLLMNGEFVRQGSGDRRLQHGDVVAFAASTELAVQPGSVAAAPPRKRFIAFSFEVGTITNGIAAVAQPRRSAPGVPMAPPQRPEERIPIADEGCGQREDEKPPDGTTAGYWRSVDDASQTPENAVFCLEIHGDGVRTELPSHARQLLYCLPANAATMPALRVGQHYQHSFWRRVLKSPNGVCSLATDHFEIRPLRRTDSADIRFRLRVLGSAGLVLNYGTACQAGEERDLQPSNTLTVADNAGAVSPMSRGLPNGLHFTFIPFTRPADRVRQEGGSNLSQASSPHSLPPQLPEVDIGYEVNDGPLIERSFGGGPRSSITGLTLKASALKPPTTFSEPKDGDADSSPERSRVVGEDYGQRFEVQTPGHANSRRATPPSMVHTRILAPSFDEDDEASPPIAVDDAEEEEEVADDLFARSGFISKSSIAAVTAAAIARENAERDSKPFKAPF